MSRLYVQNRAPMDAPLGTRLAADRDWSHMLVRAVAVGVIAFAIGLAVFQ